ncbi:hypothetical protein ACMGE7_08400 [Macrococcus equi]|uniref:hypothetical protein n=1 Tax=Macrococcus equi TaxID=3395462 RepID=UPI0039BE5791
MCIVFDYTIRDIEIFNIFIPIPHAFIVVPLCIVLTILEEEIEDFEQRNFRSWGWHRWYR